MDYIRPELVIVQFETDDVIATSVGSSEPTTTLPTYLDPEDSIGGELG